MLAGGHEHLATHVAALLLRRQLILEVDTGGAGLNEGLRQLEYIQGAAEPASPSATMGANQSMSVSPSAQWI